MIGGLAEGVLEIGPGGGGQSVHRIEERVGPRREGVAVAELGRLLDAGQVRLQQVGLLWADRPVDVTRPAACHGRDTRDRSERHK
jgi:hypothetical protein